MSTIADFNRIDDCDKIDPGCIDAFHEFTYDQDNAPTVLCDRSSWGGDCIDLTPIVKAAETLTRLYLSPEEDPECLIYEPERGDNNCIHGDDLSRIISMQLLKDVSQETAPSDGIVYMYNGSTGLFEPYDLKTEVYNIWQAIYALQNRMTAAEQAIANHEGRLQVIEAKLTPPADAPSDVKVVFGNINDYSDPNVVINEGTGTVSSLDKTHGLYTHTLATNAYGDEIFG